MNEISTQELKKLMEKKEKFILLDCRGVDYYNWEHLPGAINLRWKHVQSKAEQILKDKSALIITSCDGFTCKASVRCLENLERLGYTNVKEYSDGIAHWKASGYLTEKISQYHITANVYRFPSQEFYGEPVGSYLIETNDFILLIDGPQNLTEEHQDFIAHFGKPIKLFLSHGATGGGGKILQKLYGAKIYLHKDDVRSEWLTVTPDVLIEDGYKFNKELIVIHSPGHTPGSAVLYNVKNKILFSGDHLEGENHNNIYNFIKKDDGYSGNKVQRLKSARKLLKYDFGKILPFHYEMIPKNAKDVLKIFLKRYGNIT